MISRVQCRDSVGVAAVASGHFVDHVVSRLLCPRHQTGALNEAVVRPSVRPSARLSVSVLCPQLKDSIF